MYMKNYDQQIISLALEGGYNPSRVSDSNTTSKVIREGLVESVKYQIFLDPTFWQSLSKRLKWGYHPNGKLPDYYWMWLFNGIWTETTRIKDRESDNTHKKYWLYYWYCFVDALSKGKSTENFFKELLTLRKKT